MDLGETTEFWGPATHGIHGLVSVIVQPCLTFTLLSILINLVLFYW